MEEIVKCPYCDAEISINTEKCPVCGEFFTEPNLGKIKFQNFGLYCVLQVLTIGLFAKLWFIINYFQIKKLIINPKDVKKISALLLLLIAAITALFILKDFASIILYALQVAITYRVFRIIQKYTIEKYDVELDFNPYYLIFFADFYLVHFIDTYTDRVINAHNYFNFRTPSGFILILMLIVIALFINFWYGLCLELHGLR